MAGRQSTRSRQTRLQAEELSILCEQIALILRSGLPLHDGVEALCDNYRHTKLAERFQALSDEVLASGSVYRGMVAAGIFPRYLAGMANIGEHAGELDTVMDGLSLYYQREAKIRRAVINAVTYPLVLIAMMAVLIAVLITRVLPIFEGVFLSLGLDTAASPWVATGMGLGKAVLIAAVGLIALVLALLLTMRLDRSMRVRALVFRVFSPLGRIERRIAASRFASVMAMMLRSGFPLDESLQLVGGVVGTPDVAQKVDECRAAMAEGLSFPEAVEKLGIFDTLHCRMIRVGFQTGRTDTVLQKVATLYEDAVDDAITHTVSIIEPSLVALLSVIIGAILLAVMLPLLSLMGGMA